MTSIILFCYTNVHIFDSSTAPSRAIFSSSSHVAKIPRQLSARSLSHDRTTVIAAVKYYHTPYNALRCLSGRLLNIKHRNKIRNEIKCLPRSGLNGRRRKLRIISNFQLATLAACSDGRRCLQE